MKAQDHQRRASTRIADHTREITNPNEAVTRIREYGVVSCSADLDDDDESVTCKWSDVSEDRVWRVFVGDLDEQEILQMDGSDREPNDSEMEMDICMDFCAAEFVIPLGLVNSPVRPSEGSRKGRFYRGASGDNIFNECEQRVQFLDERGRLMAMTFLVEKVTRPLGSLLKMTQAGTQIRLDSDGWSCTRSQEPKHRFVRKRASS